MQLKKDKRHSCLKLFAVLLNVNSFDTAIKVRNTIMHIYGDPTAVRTNDCIQQLITVKDTLQFDIDKCLDDENVMKDNDDKMELDSVDELL
ncbi:unnamed protein product, partial [Didymodactylos carnosus]